MGTVDRGRSGALGEGERLLPLFAPKDGPDGRCDDQGGSRRLDRLKRARDGTVNLFRTPHELVGQGRVAWVGIQLRPARRRAPRGVAPARRALQPEAQWRRRLAAGSHHALPPKPGRVRRRTRCRFGVTLVDGENSHAHKAHHPPLYPLDAEVGGRPRWARVPLTEMYLSEQTSGPACERRVGLLSDDALEERSSLCKVSRRKVLEPQVVQHARIVRANLVLCRQQRNFRRRRPFRASSDGTYP